VSDEFGPPRIAVSCAGLCEPLELERLTARDWERTIATNLSASYYVARDCGLRMRADGGGSIVNIGSEMGAIGARGYVAYAASKAGVAGLTRALAAELAPHVTVNAVCPGPVDTPMLRAELEQTGDAPAAMRAQIERVPLKRIATADEVAAAVLFLATNAGFATGTMLALDGGTTIV
jgi:NAD(P)-dependent dehydrogenase (short-subunit alcohol dehydrogenase family)